MEYFVNFEAILDNYLSYATVEYFTNTAVMEASFAVCEKLLVGGTVVDTVCKVTAGELISCMMHEAKGLTLPLPHPSNTNTTLTITPPPTTTTMMSITTTDKSMPTPEQLAVVSQILDAYLPRCVMLLLKALMDSAS
uniref:Importin-8 n=1 Tax=Lygus hesperus TaxID=30085 RepID=A0A0A9XW41_LYGHE